MAVDVSAREYRTIREASGPLIVVGDVEGVSYGEGGSENNFTLVLALLVLGLFPQPQPQLLPNEVFNPH